MIYISNDSDDEYRWRIWAECLIQNIELSSGPYVTNKASIIQLNSSAIVHQIEAIRDNLGLIWDQNGNRYVFNVYTSALHYS